jgi:hypothetical protein
MTSMATPAAARSSRHVTLTEPQWKWPVDLHRYDRAPELSTAELQALASLGDEVRWWGWSELRPHPAWSGLERLVQSLADARAALETPTRHARVSGDAAVAEIVR